METAWAAAILYLVLAAGAHYGINKVHRWAQSLAGDLAPDDDQAIFFGLRPRQLWEGLARGAELAPWLLWAVYGLYLVGLVPALSELRAAIYGYLATAWDAFAGIYTQPLFDMGDTGLSIQLLVSLMMALLITIFLASLARRFIRQRILARTKLDIGVQHALATGIAYLFIFFGFLVALETVGVDLSTFTVIAGALSIGVGFGLQHVANNFISGLILLAERPIKVGDRVEVGNVHGRVVQIKTRATTVRTNDNVFIIVPNSEFISGRVTNWAHADHDIRFRVPIGVAYGSDIDTVEQALLEAAAQVPQVMRQPPPTVQLVGFGDSSVDLHLLIWTRECLHRRGYLISEVNKAMYAKLMEYGVEIPFPQQDLHFRGALELAAAHNGETQARAGDGSAAGGRPASPASGAGPQGRDTAAAEARPGGDLPQPPSF